MKLWELRPAPGILVLSVNESAWMPLGDKVTAFVVRADSEDEARRLASEVPRREIGSVWLDGKLTTCVQLSQDDRGAEDAGVVMVDSRADWLSACCAASKGVLR